ncbi:MAG: RIP metalloprotease RseP [Gemmatimonadales bacterium]
MLLSVGALIIVLGVLIFIHEAGHFIAAKLAGIHVHRFSLGLGAPIKALSFTRGGTEYAVSWIPLGGYVKMATAEEEVTSSALEGGRPQREVAPDQYFESKPVWVRMVVILAGVTMNALFAWAIYTFIIAKDGLPYNPTTTVGSVVEDLPSGAEALSTLVAGDSITAIGDTPVDSWGEITQLIQSTSHETIVIHLAGKAPVELTIHPDALVERMQAAVAIRPYQPAVVGGVLADTPAEGAGMVTGDTILSVDGSPTPQWDDLVEFVSQNPGRELAFVLRRGQGADTVLATPAATVDTTVDGELRTVGRIGIVLQPTMQRRSLSLGAAVVAGAERTANMGTIVIRSVRGLLTGRVPTRELGGPIMIGQLAGAMAQAGIDAFLLFMALISINLAVLNLLPIPVLDGGQFLFLLAEGVMRRPLSLKLRERLTAVGLVMIMMLMGLAFWNDLSRLFRDLFG